MKAMRFIAPGKETWLFRSDFDLSNSFGIASEFEPDMKRLVEAFRRIGTELVVVVQPTRGLMNPQRVDDDYRYNFDFEVARHNLKNYLNQLQQAGAHVPDVVTLIDSSLEEDYFFRRDHHWTPYGAKVTAQLAADYIKQLPLYEDLETKEYITEASTYLPKDGTMNRALRRICGNNFGSQYVKGYQTVPVSSGEDALFGDVSDPSVVLVGTSNSAERDDDYKNYNFGGFLKEFLMLDILNYAMPGAGDIGSLVQYLQSDDFDYSNPPKLIIWELPASYPLSEDKIYRQLIPAVQGACNSADEILVNELQLPSMAPAERIEILSNAGRSRKRLSNSNGFLQLDFSNKNIKDFYVITYYDNGERDKIWFRRANIVDGGRYLLELSKDEKFQNANLMSVFLEPSEPISDTSTLKARLCR
ncbi:alginate biosynthesis protein AlgX [Litoribrevibacter euphylliae]|uniref:Alginate biosynthesis protein AlgX n=1 Tax=Litoribrevibacter euphylliae TaxID=1834034 RepID=A0ABV7HKT1_9GAMM